MKHNWQNPPEWLNNYSIEVDMGGYFQTIGRYKTRAEAEAALVSLKNNYQDKELTIVDTRQIKLDIEKNPLLN